MEEKKEFINELEERLNYDSPHGSIVVEESTTASSRKNLSYFIKFVTRNGNTIELGTRSIVAQHVGDLLKNFGEFTTIKPSTDESQVYTYRTLKVQRMLLKKLFENTEYKFERNPEPKNYSCRITYKDQNEL